MTDTPHYPTAKYRYFLLDGYEGETTYYRTASERDEAAKTLISMYLDGDGWHEGVDQIICGVTTHVVQQTNVVQRPKREDYDSDDDYQAALDDFGYMWIDECDYTCEYEMKELPDDP